MVLQHSFLHLRLSVCSSYQLVTNSVYVDGLWAPKFHSFVCQCQVATLCELASERLFFFLFRKTTAFHHLSLALKKFLHLHVNNIVICGYTTNFRKHSSQSCIRHIIRSLITSFPHRHARFTHIASRLYYCSATPRLF